jgi:hypothetical protein
MSTSGSSNWPTSYPRGEAPFGGALPGLGGLDDGHPAGPSSQNGPPDHPPRNRPSSFPQEGTPMDERAFRWALVYADRQSAVAYWWGLGAGLALGVLIGSFAAGTALVAALFHGK